MRSHTFGALLAIAGVSTPFVVLWLRHRALREPVAVRRPATDAEREFLQRRGRWSIISFVCFWLIAAGLVVAISVIDASPLTQRAVLVVILLMVIGTIAQHLSTRCPICNYRLGYQRSLGIPARCERCGAECLTRRGV